MSAYRNLFTGGALFFLLASSVFADSTYVNSQIALLKPAGSTVGYGAVITVGMPVPERKNLFLEAELTATLVNPKKNSRELTYRGAGGYGVYQRLINEQLAIHAKAGMLYQYSEKEGNDSQSGAGIAFALGGTLRQNREMSYLLELSSVQGTLDLTTLSAGIRYRFR